MKKKLKENEITILALHLGYGGVVVMKQLPQSMTMV